MLVSREVGAGLSAALVQPLVSILETCVDSRVFRVILSNHSRERYEMIDLQPS